MKEFYTKEKRYIRRGAVQECVATCPVCLGLTMPLDFFYSKRVRHNGKIQIELVNQNAEPDSCCGCAAMHENLADGLCPDCKSRLEKAFFSLFDSVWNDMHC